MAELVFGAMMKCWRFIGCNPSFKNSA